MLDNFSFHCNDASTLRPRISRIFYKVEKVIRIIKSVRFGFKYFCRSKVFIEERNGRLRFFSSQSKLLVLTRLMYSSVPITVHVHVFRFIK